MRIIKKLSKIIGLVAATTFFAASVFATTMGSEYSTKKDEMIKSLNLTPEQQTQVETIMTKSHDERMAVMKKYENMQGPAKMRSMRPELEGIHAKTQAELSAILDADQMMKVEQFQDEMLATVKAEMKANK